MISIMLATQNGRSNRVRISVNRSEKDKVAPWLSMWRGHSCPRSSQIYICLRLHPDALPNFLR